MSLGLEEQIVAKETAKYGVTKIGSSVLRDARIVCSITGEDMQDFLTRLLAPAVKKAKEDAFERERYSRDVNVPKKKPEH